MALAIRRGHEHADIGSQDFGLRVTEETLGRSAEGQHFSPFVDDDHRIGNSRQDGAKMRLAVAQSAFGRALVGNVADDDGKDRKSTRLNSSPKCALRMNSSS